MAEPAAFDPEPMLSRLAGKPGDIDALTELAAACRRLGALAPPGLDVAHSVDNLLGRLLDGTVAPSATTATLLAEACRGLAAADGEPVDDLLERLDLAASGLEADFDDSAAPPAATLGEPPLLTIRHDGARVTVGSFEDQPASDDGDDWPRPQEHARTDAATMIAHTVHRLRAQIDALGDTAGADLAPLVEELAATAAELEELAGALAANDRS